MWHSASDLERSRRLARALLRDPRVTGRERARVRVILGRAALAAGRYAEAERALTAALSGAPLEPAIAASVAIDAADAALRNGRPREARAVMERLARAGADRFPADSWAQLQSALARVEAYAGDLLAAADRLRAVRARAVDHKRLAGRAETETLAEIEALLAKQERDAEEVGGEERARSIAALAREAEPKRDAFRWAVAAHRAHAAAEIAMAQGHWPPRVPRVSPLARLAAGEARVTMTVAGGMVHAWVERSDGGLVAHLSLLPVAEWEAIAAELHAAWMDASGWPDGVAPAHLTVDGGRGLDRAALAVWTPLWPALEGVARVAIAADPTLSPLPWSGFALVASPALQPRPRAVVALPNASVPRPPAWREPGERVLALSHRQASTPFAEREAKAVIRLLGGEWLEAIRLRDGADGARRALLGHLRSVRLWHVGIPIGVVPERPHGSTLAAGDDEVPIWWLVRQALKIPLAVASMRASAVAQTPARGEVVGRITPAGPRVMRRRPAPAPVADASAAIARLLLGGPAARLVMRTHAADTAVSAAVLGSFYAGIARGDPPAESLFLAQRKAYEEGLHPATWANVTHWGWF